MKTILIVEDTKDYADSLQFIISRAGYNVVLAADGEEGLQKALHIKPNLILMDVLMPGQDGAETTMKIREQPTLKDIPIIFLTALATEKNEDFLVNGLKYPAISKMMDQQDILDKIREYIN